MRRDPIGFRERFKAWKRGEDVYKDGRPIPAFEIGKDGFHVEYVDAGKVRVDPETGDVITKTDARGGLMLPEVTVRGKRANTKNSKPKYGDYLTASNDATLVISRNPNIRSIKPINPHLAERANQGAKAHAAWEEEHPNLTTWGNVLGAVPFAVAAYPLAATAGSGIAALGDAAAATTVGKGLTNFLAPAATSIAGTPAFEWANIGLSSLSAAHGASQAIEDGGISPMTALELAPMLQVAKPMVNEAALAVENYRYPLGRPQVPEGYLTLKPQTRTRVGDVEIDNPQLAYRQGDKEIVEDFFKSGEVRTPDESYAVADIVTTKNGFDFDFGSRTFENPMFAQGRLWYGLPERQGDGLLITAEPLGVARQSSRLMNSKMNGTFDLRYPDVGQSGRRVQLEEGQLSPSNTTAYTWEPRYGYKRILPKDAPTIEWAEATAPKITAENAASITPEQWTAAQDAAIARGDMAEAQRLRDLHFRDSAPNTKITEGVYHGSRRGEDFNSFDLKYFGYTDGGTGGYGHYFGPLNHAVAYTNPRKFYLNVENPYTGKHIQFFNRDSYFRDNELFGRIPSRENAIRYKEGFEKYKNEFAGKDGIIDNDPIWGNLGPVYTVPRGEQIKLADAVTFDDNGIRIPLGSRDNFNINDIRYGLIPFGIGLTGYGLSNWNDVKFPIKRKIK